jgi:hypothetical protein
MRTVNLYGTFFIMGSGYSDHSFYIHDPTRHAVTATINTLLT